MAANHIEPDSFGFLVADVSRLIRSEMDRRTGEAGIGLTPGEGRALVYAARAGAVRQNVLADRMGLEPMTLSAYLDRLEAQRLVERRPDPADRRAKIVHLTDAAHEIIARIAPVGAAIRAEASQGIAPEDWLRLLESLKTVRENLSAKRAASATRENAAA
jgi:MarR family transcriptional regulator, transcriptional regulator for hemolysin